MVVMEIEIVGGVNHRYLSLSYSAKNMYTSTPLLQVYVGLILLSFWGQVTWAAWSDAPSDTGT